jgi:hypothetical protein
MLVCEPCGRRSVYSVERLYDRHGDAQLPGLLDLLSADCLKKMANKITDRCTATFVWPNGAPQARER